MPQVGSFFVSNSILAEGGSECAGIGVLTTGGYNVEEDPDMSVDCGLNGAGDVHPLGAIGLNPLADNGGQTMTRSLAATSVAVNRVPLASCPGAPDNTDQRGNPRPHVAGCDSGAYELGDMDGDGVLDTADSCPTQAGPASNNGCPVAVGPLTPAASPVQQPANKKKCKKKKRRGAAAARKCKRKKR